MTARAPSSRAVDGGDQGVGRGGRRYSGVRVEKRGDGGREGPGAARAEVEDMLRPYFSRGSIVIFIDWIPRSPDCEGCGTYAWTRLRIRTRCTRATYVRTYALGSPRWRLALSLFSSSSSRSLLVRPDRLFAPFCARFHVSHPLIARS